MKKRIIAESIAKFRLRYSRGDGLLGFSKDILKNIVYLGGMGFLLNEWFGVTFSKELTIFLALGYLLSCYFIGLIDERIGFWKYENTYSTKELNPFWKEIEEKVDNLADKIERILNNQKVVK